MRKHAAKRKSTVRDLKAKTPAARRVSGGIIIICKPSASAQRLGDFRVVKLGDGSV
jgi:hypothetical protein